MALTTKKIAKLVEPGRYGDGRGLCLQITPTGVRSWCLRFERNGRERLMGLGPVADFSLAEARERARLARQQLKDGIDPIDARRAARAKQVTDEALAAAKGMSFEACALEYFKFHSPKWQNAKHRKQFLSTLKMYAFPIMGKLPVAAIDKALVLRALSPIWHKKTKTASRVRGRIENVLDFAKVNGWRDDKVENPAAWTGNLEHALPASGLIAPAKHHAALPFTDMPDFVAQLRKREGMAARALEFTILTATRTTEAINARWDEIDLDAKLWVVPAGRMKVRREHRVPLADRAIAILRALPRESEFLFPGAHEGSPLRDTAMPHLLQRMKRDDLTVHGFRSTFRDWAAERTTYPNHICEMALAHTVGNKVEAAYRRGDLLEQRKQLMSDWARFCETKLVDVADNVTPIRGRA